MLAFRGRFLFFLEVDSQSQMINLLRMKFTSKIKLESDFSLRFLVKHRRQQQITIVKANRAAIK